MSYKSYGGIRLYRNGAYGLLFRLSPGACTIGKSISANLRLRTQTGIEDIHCFISVDKTSGIATLTNKATEHPVKVNGIEIKDSAILVQGDVISIYDKQILYENEEMSQEVIDKIEKPNKLVYKTPRKGRMSSVPLKTTSRRGSMTPEPKKKTPIKPRKKRSNSFSSMNELENISEEMNTFKSPARRASNRVKMANGSFTAADTSVSSLHPSTPEINTGNSINNFNYATTPGLKPSKHPSTPQIKKTFNVVTPKSAAKPTLRNEIMLRNMSKTVKHSPQRVKTPVTEHIPETYNTPENNTSIVVIDSPDEEITPFRSRKSIAKNKSMQRLTENDNSVIILDTPHSKTPKSASKTSKTPKSALKKTKLITELLAKESSTQQESLFIIDSTLEESVMSDYTVESVYDSRSGECEQFSTPQQNSNLLEITNVDSIKKGTPKEVKRLNKSKNSFGASTSLKRSAKKLRKSRADDEIKDSEGSFRKSIRRDESNILRSGKKKGKILEKSTLDLIQFEEKLASQRKSFRDSFIASQQKVNDLNVTASPQTFFHKSSVMKTPQAMISDDEETPMKQLTGISGLMHNLQKYVESTPIVLKNNSIVDSSINDFGEEEEIVSPQKPFRISGLMHTKITPIASRNGEEISQQYEDVTPVKSAKSIEDFDASQNSFRNTRNSIKSNSEAGTSSKQMRTSVTLNEAQISFKQNRKSLNNEEKVMIPQKSSTETRKSLKSIEFSPQHSSIHARKTDKDIEKEKSFNQSRKSLKSNEVNIEETVLSPQKSYRKSLKNVEKEIFSSQKTSTQTRKSLKSNDENIVEEKSVKEKRKSLKSIESCSPQNTSIPTRKSIDEDVEEENFTPQSFNQSRKSLKSNDGNIEETILSPQKSYRKSLKNDKEEIFLSQSFTQTRKSLKSNDENDSEEKSFRKSLKSINGENSFNERGAGDYHIQSRISFTERRKSLKAIKKLGENSNTPPQKSKLSTSLQMQTPQQYEDITPVHSAKKLLHSDDFEDQVFAESSSIEETRKSITRRSRTSIKNNQSFEIETDAPQNLFRQTIKSLKNGEDLSISPQKLYRLRTSFHNDTEVFSSQKSPNQSRKSLNVDKIDVEEDFEVEAQSYRLRKSFQDEAELFSPQKSLNQSRKSLNVNEIDVEEDFEIEAQTRRSVAKNHNQEEVELDLVSPQKSFNQTRKSINFRKSLENNQNEREDYEVIVSPQRSAKQTRTSSGRKSAQINGQEGDSELETLSPQKSLNQMRKSIGSSKKSIKSSNQEEEYPSPQNASIQLRKSNVDSSRKNKIQSEEKYSEMEDSLPQKSFRSGRSGVETPQNASIQMRKSNVDSSRKSTKNNIQNENHSEMEDSSNQNTSIPMQKSNVGTCRKSTKSNIEDTEEYSEMEDSPPQKSFRSGRRSEVETPQNASIQMRKSNVGSSRNFTKSNIPDEDYSEMEDLSNHNTSIQLRKSNVGSSRKSIKSNIEDEEYSKMEDSSLQKSLRSGSRSGVETPQNASFQMRKSNVDSSRKSTKNNIQNENYSEMEDSSNQNTSIQLRKSNVGSSRKSTKSNIEDDEEYSEMEDSSNQITSIQLRKSNVGSCRKSTKSNIEDAEDYSEMEDSPPQKSFRSGRRSEVETPQNASIQMRKSNVGSSRKSTKSNIPDEDYSEMEDLSNHNTSIQLRKSNVGSSRKSTKSNIEDDEEYSEMEDSSNQNTSIQLEKSNVDSSRKSTKNNIQDEYYSEMEDLSNQNTSIQLRKSNVGSSRKSIKSNIEDEVYSEMEDSSLQKSFRSGRRSGVETLQNASIQMRKSNVDSSRKSTKNNIQSENYSEMEDSSNQNTSIQLRKSNVGSSRKSTKNQEYLEKENFSPRRSFISDKKSEVGSMSHQNSSIETRKSNIGNNRKSTKNNVQEEKEYSSPQKSFRSGRKSARSNYADVEFDSPQKSFNVSSNDLENDVFEEAKSPRKSFRITRTSSKYDDYINPLKTARKSVTASQENNISPQQFEFVQKLDESEVFDFQDEDFVDEEIDVEIDDDAVEIEDAEVEIEDDVASPQKSFRQSRKSNEKENVLPMKLNRSFEKSPPKTIRAAHSTSLMSFMQPSGSRKSILQTPKLTVSNFATPAKTPMNRKSIRFQDDIIASVESKKLRREAAFDQEDVAEEGVCTPTNEGPSVGESDDKFKTPDTNTPFISKSALKQRRSTIKRSESKHTPRVLLTPGSEMKSKRSLNNFDTMLSETAANTDSDEETQNIAISRKRCRESSQDSILLSAKRARISKNKSRISFNLNISMDLLHTSSPFKSDNFLTETEKELSILQENEDKLCNVLSEILMVNMPVSKALSEPRRHRQVTSRRSLPASKILSNQENISEFDNNSLVESIDTSSFIYMPGDDSQTQIRQSMTILHSQVSDGNYIVEEDFDKFKNSVKEMRGKIQKEPENDLRSPRGIKQLMKTPKAQKEPENDLRSPREIKQLMKTPKAQKEPENDLRSPRGVKQLMKTPKVHKEPENDLTRIQGVKQLMKTSKVQKQPLNDISSPKGLKQLMKTPKVQNEPKNDLMSPRGIKKLMQTPKVQNEPKNDLTNPLGIKKLMQTPKIQNEPKNDLMSPRGVKQLMKTPKSQNEPKNDLMSPAGVKQLMKTPKLQREPENNLLDVSGVADIFAPHVDLNVSGVSVLQDDDDFTLITGKRTVRTYGRKTLSPEKSTTTFNSRKTEGVFSDVLPDVQKWAAEHALQKVNDEAEVTSSVQVSSNKKIKSGDAESETPLKRKIAIDEITSSVDVATPLKELGTGPKSRRRNISENSAGKSKINTPTRSRRMKAALSTDEMTNIEEATVTAVEATTDSTEETNIDAKRPKGRNRKNKAPKGDENKISEEVVLEEVHEPLQEVEDITSDNDIKKPGIRSRKPSEDEDKSSDEEIKKATVKRTRNKKVADLVKEKEIKKPVTRGRRNKKESIDEKNEEEKSIVNNEIKKKVATGNSKPAEVTTEEVTVNEGIQKDEEPESIKETDDITNMVEENKKPATRGRRNNKVAKAGEIEAIKKTVTRARRNIKTTRVDSIEDTSDEEVKEIKKSTARKNKVALEQISENHDSIIEEITPIVRDNEAVEAFNAEGTKKSTRSTRNKKVIHIPEVIEDAMLDEEVQEIKKPATRNKSNKATSKKKQNGVLETPTDIQQTDDEVQEIKKPALKNKTNKTASKKKQVLETPTDIEESDDEVQSNKTEPTKRATRNRKAKTVDDTPTKTTRARGKAINKISESPPSRTRKAASKQNKKQNNIVEEDEESTPSIKQTSSKPKKLQVEVSPKSTPTRAKKAVAVKSKLEKTSAPKRRTKKTKPDSEFEDSFEAIGKINAKNLIDDTIDSDLDATRAKRRPVKKAAKVVHFEVEEKTSTPMPVVPIKSTRKRIQSVEDIEEAAFNANLNVPAKRKKTEKVVTEPIRKSSRKK